MKTKKIDQKQNDKNIFHKIGKQIKRVPWYGWVAGVVFFLLQLMFYNVAKPIIENWSCAWQIVPVIDELDGMIPLIPYFWVQIYFFSWVFWIFAPIVASVTKKENFLNYLIGLFASYVVGFLIFIFMPTYMNREMVAGVGSVGAGHYGDLNEAIKDKSGLSYWMMRLMIGNDGGVNNYNLFPSFHCSISLYAYLAIRKQPEVSKGSKIYALILVPLICLSTIFTKQHYIVDIFGGILLAIICYAIVGWFNPGAAIVKKWPNIFVIKRKKHKVQKDFK